MNSDDKAALKFIRRWIIGLSVGIVIISFGAAIASRAFDLAWFPWEVKMKTGMIRNSNSYVTTQQAALRQLRSSYDDSDATPGQRALIAGQMHEIADLIPDDVQPDIRSFLRAH